MSTVCAIPHISPNSCPSKLIFPTRPVRTRNRLQRCVWAKSLLGWGRSPSGWVPPSPLASNACATNATNARCHLKECTTSCIFLSFRIFDQCDVMPKSQNLLIYPKSKKISTLFLVGLYHIP